MLHNGDSKSPCNNIKSATGYENTSMCYRAVFDIIISNRGKGSEVG